jgi:hypothetical protein
MVFTTPLPKFVDTPIEENIVVARRISALRPCEELINITRRNSKGINLL